MREETVANRLAYYGVPGPREQTDWLRAAFRVANRNSLSDAVRFGIAARASQPFREQWLPFLDEFAATHGLEAPSVDLMMKPLNQYLVLGLPLSERVRLLRAHYAALVKVASRRLIACIWAGEALEVGTISGKSERYGIWLCATPLHLTRKEGELTLVLQHSESGQVLAKLTFLLSSTASDRLGVMVGGVQGPRSSTAKQAIISATRDLFGLRPRDAMLVALSSIANRIGAEKIWGVSNSMHVHNARSRRHRERWHVDYDGFWAERGATRGWPFGWVMNVPAHPSRTGTTASGKRRDILKESVWCLGQSTLSGPMA